MSLQLKSIYTRAELEQRCKNAKRRRHVKTGKLLRGVSPIHVYVYKYICYIYINICSFRLQDVLWSEKSWRELQYLEFVTMWYTDRLWEHETIYRLLTQCSIHVFVRGKPRGLETHWSEKLVAMAHHDRNHGARQLHDKLRNKSLFKPVPLKKAFESRPDEPTAGWSSSRQLFYLCWLQFLAVIEGF